MSIKIKKSMEISALLLLIATTCFMNLGCTCGKYNSFTVDKGIAHFSFEYPSCYEINNVEVQNDQNFQMTDIWISGPRNSLLEKWEAPTSILIFAGPYSFEEQNVRTAMDRKISGESIWPDFKLLNRFPVTIAGSQGEEAVYSFTASDSIPNRGLNYPKIGRVVYFERGGILFSITMLSSPLNANSDKLDFDHILNTFKIFP